MLRSMSYRVRPQLKTQGVTFNTARVSRYAHRDVLEEVNWIIFNVVGDEKIICHSQESHLRDGEDVHELLHLWSL